MMNMPAVMAVYMGLMLFGIGFNLVVTVAEDRGWMNGYTSLFVVAGVLVTLGGVAVVSWEYALVALGAFGASGTPMILGSIWRHVRDREEQLQAMRREANGDGM